jgi:predicted transposase/invertase (TIGR01784 family)
MSRGDCILYFVNNCPQKSDNSFLALNLLYCSKQLSMRTIMKFYNPCNDVAFKKVFNSHPDLTMSFLNAVLKLEGERTIEKVEFLPQEQLPKVADSKKSILDVKCTDQRGLQYIIEVQNSKMVSYLHRVQYYIAHSYSSQLAKTGKYLDLKPITMLSISNHLLFPKEVPCVSYHTNIEQGTGNSYLSDMSYAFVELPKFNKKEDELVSVIDHWIYLLRSAEHTDHIPINAPSEVKDAFKILEAHGWSKEEHEAYVQAKMFILDEEDKIETAFSEGRVEGEQIGLEKGEQIGLEKGIKAVALNMLKLGMKIEDISKATSLNIDEIKKMIF